MRTPDDIFTEVKSRVPSIKKLVVQRDSDNGNKKELWVQCNDYLEIEVRKLIPILLEWTNIY